MVLHVPNDAGVLTENFVPINNEAMVNIEVVLNDAGEETPVKVGVCKEIA